MIVSSMMMISRLTDRIARVHQRRRYVSPRPSSVPISVRSSAPVLRSMRLWSCEVIGPSSPASSLDTTALPAYSALLHYQSLRNILFDYLLLFGVDVNNQSPASRSEPNVTGS